MISSPLCETVDYGYPIVFLHSAACGHSQTPHILPEAFKFHESLAETGDMHFKK